ncbi:MAG: Clp protease N-terminal domain-containing protein [Anaerolineales bacterium]|nr:Clp protease N-terminal domain-containing protein [Anaerolineales bacterium]
MTNFSMPLLLAWDIAANEAGRARSRMIEPEHLFIGLCKLEDFATVTPLIDLGYDVADAEAMQPEIGALNAVFYQFNLSPATLRRKLRHRKSSGMLSLINSLRTGILQSSAQEGDSAVIHRSPASKAAFARAGEFAAICGSANINVLHLLAALLDSPDSGLSMWLRRYVEVAALRNAALEAQITRR